MIPSRVITYVIRCEDGANHMQYKIDAIGTSEDGPAIFSAYQLQYQLWLWTMNSASVSVLQSKATRYTPATAEATFSATLEEYGIVVQTYAGYLTVQIDNIGRFRTSYNFI